MLRRSRLVPSQLLGGCSPVNSDRGHQGCFSKVWRTFAPLSSSRPQRAGREGFRIEIGYAAKIIIEGVTQWTESVTNGLLLGHSSFGSWRVVPMDKTTRIGETRVRNGK